MLALVLDLNPLPFASWLSWAKATITGCLVLAIMLLIFSQARPGSSKRWCVAALDFRFGFVFSMNWHWSCICKVGLSRGQRHHLALPSSSPWTAILSLCTLLKKLSRSIHELDDAGFSSMLSIFNLMSSNHILILFIYPNISDTGVKFQIPCSNTDALNTEQFPNTFWFLFAFVLAQSSLYTSEARQAKKVK